MSAKVVFFITFAVFVSQASSQSTPFRKDYTYDSQTRTFYKENIKARSWKAAVFTCTGEGAELAVPSTEAEMQGIVRHMSADTTSVWLGIHDAKSNGKFIMVNGTKTQIAFETDGPSNGKKTCVGMLRSGDYSAYDCDTSRKFVCVKDSASVTSNSGCETYDMEYFYSIDADRCYKVHTTPKGWNNARKICMLEEATSAVLNSIYESDIIVNILKQHEENTLWGNFDKGVIHLGFKDFKTGEGFITSDGKSLALSGFEEWAPGQPAPVGDGAQCGAMLRNGKLTVVECRQKAIFICEKVLGKDHVPSLDIRFSIDD